jgi:hypothetical protein
MRKSIFITVLIFNCIINNFQLIAQPNIQWEKSLGGSSNETARSVIQTLDGGYIVAGGTSSNDGDITLNQGGLDCWVVKLDANGNLEWQKTYGGSGNESIATIIQLPDSSFTLFSTTNSIDGDVGNGLGSQDIWVIKIDKTGNILWEKTFGGSDTEFLTKAISVGNDDFVFCGYTESNDGDVTLNKGSRDYWLVKIDTSGNILWQKTYGGSLLDRAFSLLQTEDEGFLVLGESNSTDGDISNNIGGDDYWVVKTDSLGNIEWEKSYGGSQDERGLACALGVNGGYILAGRTFSDDGDVSNHFGTTNRDDYWVVKIDDLGNIEWENSYGGTQSDEAVEILPYNGGYVVLGSINSSNGMISTFYGDTALIDPDYWLIQIDTIGNLLWEKNYGGSSGDWPFGMIIGNDNSIVMTGSANSTDYDVSNNNGGGFWVVKLDAITGIEKQQVNKGLSIFPNPTENEFNVDFKFEKGQIEVYDIFGQKIISVTAKKGNVRIHLNNVKKGTYIIKIKSEDEISTGKLIIK